MYISLLSTYISAFEKKYLEENQDSLFVYNIHDNRTQ